MGRDTVLPVGGNGLGLAERKAPGRVTPYIRPLTYEVVVSPQSYSQRDNGLLSVVLTITELKRLAVAYHRIMEGADGGTTQ